MMSAEGNGVKRNHPYDTYSTQKIECMISLFHTAKLNIFSVEYKTFVFRLFKLALFRIFFFMIMAFLEHRTLYNARFFLA